MKGLAEEFVGLMRDLDWELDYSEQSVQTLEEMIEQQFEDWQPWRSGKVASSITKLRPPATPSSTSPPHTPL